jgi:TRAP-type C4-dicarboxylate transport system permease small subunit
LLLASFLVLPLAALLFAQWPLRELVQAGSRQANDGAQILFALYAAVAVTAASRAGIHLSAGHTADSPGPAARWRAWALAACIVPWAIFMLWISAGSVWQSLAGLEKFPETLSPGYFLIKLAVWLLLWLALLQALLDLRARRK